MREMWQLRGESARKDSEVGCVSVKIWVSNKLQRREIRFDDARGVPSDEQQRPVQWCSGLGLADESFCFAFFVSKKQRTRLSRDDEEKSGETGESAYEKR